MHVSSCLMCCCLQHLLPLSIDAMYPLFLSHVSCDIFKPFSITVCWCRDDTRNLGRQGLNQLDGDLHALLSLENPLAVVRINCVLLCYAKFACYACCIWVLLQSKLREAVVASLAVIDKSISEKKYGVSVRIRLSNKLDPSYCFLGCLASQLAHSCLAPPSALLMSFMRLSSFGWMLPRAFEG
jgi:hypothetical protein